MTRTALPIKLNKTITGLLVNLGKTIAGSQMKTVGLEKDYDSSRVVCMHAVWEEIGLCYRSGSEERSSQDEAPSSSSSTPDKSQSKQSMEVAERKRKHDQISEEEIKEIVKKRERQNEERMKMQWVFSFAFFFSLFLGYRCLWFKVYSLSEVVCVCVCVLDDQQSE